MSNVQEQIDPNVELSYTRDLRKQLIKQLMPEGADISNDKDKIRGVTTLLKDLDSSIIQQQRNKIDDRNADTSKVVADAMVEMLKKNVNLNPFERPALPGTSGGGLEPPTLETQRLGPIDIVPGEMDIGTITEAAEDFTARMKEKYQAEMEAED